MTGRGRGRGAGAGAARPARPATVVMPFADTARWTKIDAAMQKIRSGDVRTAADLLTEMRTYNASLGDDALETLIHAFGEGEGSPEDTYKFWTELLPDMARYVSGLPERFSRREIPLLYSGMDASVEFRPEDCVAIVSAAFFCVWPFRTSHSSFDLPPFNFTGLLGPPQIPAQIGSQAAKLICFVMYTQARLYPIGGDWQGTSIRYDVWPSVVVARRKGHLALNEVLRHGGSRKFDASSVVFDTENSMHNEAIAEADREADRDTQRFGTDPFFDFEDELPTEIDFANKYFGGGVIGQRGAVQEEIRIAQCPDLLMARLICAVMEDTDVIVVSGFDLTNVTTGYGGSLRYESTIKHGLMLYEARRLVAMDATNYSRNRDFQYRRDNIAREVLKAYVGFSRGECLPMNRLAPKIYTGNWGAGDFGGDPLLKIAIQTIAATLTARRLRYFTFEKPPSTTAGLADAGRALLDTYDGKSAQEIFQMIACDPPKFDRSSSGSVGESIAANSDPYNPYIAIANGTIKPY